jgi:hypothetical protein
VYCVGNCSILRLELTEWQGPLSGLLSSMMVKSVQPGKGMSPPFHSIDHHEQRCGVRSPAERADALPLFLLYPFMYFVLDLFSVYITVQHSQHSC